MKEYLALRWVLPSHPRPPPLEGPLCAGCCARCARCGRCGCERCSHPPPERVPPQDSCHTLWASAFGPKHPPPVPPLAPHALFPPPLRLSACSRQLGKLRGEVRASVFAPKHCLPFLQPGRLVRVLPPSDAASPAADASPAAGAAAAAAATSGGGGGGQGSLGVVVNFERVGRKEQQQQQQQQEEGGGGGAGAGAGGRGGQYLVDVLCNCADASLAHTSAAKR